MTGERSISPWPLADGLALRNVGEAAGNATLSLAMADAGHARKTRSRGACSIPSPSPFAVIAPEPKQQQQQQQHLAGSHVVVQDVHDDAWLELVPPEEHSLANPPSRRERHVVVPERAWRLTSREAQAAP